MRVFGQIRHSCTTQYDGIDTVFTCRAFHFVNHGLPGSFGAVLKVKHRDMRGADLSQESLQSPRRRMFPSITGTETGSVVTTLNRQFRSAA